MDNSVVKSVKKAAGTIKYYSGKVFNHKTLREDLIQEGYSILGEIFRIKGVRIQDNPIVKRLCKNYILLLEEKDDKGYVVYGAPRMKRVNTVPSFVPVYPYRVREEDYQR
ncbi:MAG TPA: hypothetical protein VJH34_04035 [archaeon]|nr:hypothetical protein [archaeon]